MICTSLLLLRMIHIEGVSLSKRCCTLSLRSILPSISSSVATSIKKTSYLLSALSHLDPLVSEQVLSLGEFSTHKGGQTKTSSTDSKRKKYFFGSSTLSSCSFSECHNHPLLGSYVPFYWCISAPFSGFLSHPRQGLFRSIHGSIASPLTSRLQPRWKRPPNCR
jgi:hypothetical protein